MLVPPMLLSRELLTACSLRRKAEWGEETSRAFEQDRGLGEGDGRAGVRPETLAVDTWDRMALQYDVKGGG
jgi:hypothetical protein